MNKTKSGLVPGKSILTEDGKENESQDEAATENYAEHLARVAPDADSSKAQLKARYKALHDAGNGEPNTH